MSETQVTDADEQERHEDDDSASGGPAPSKDSTESRDDAGDDGVPTDGQGPGRFSFERIRWDWVGPIGVALEALFLRLWHLDRPATVMFDETYYAKDAWAMLTYGYGHAYTDDANARIEAGQTTGLFQDVPNWTVHPEVGKWMIALGEKVFGLTPFGWRIMAAVVGALMVVLIGRIVFKLTGSAGIATLGALLMAFDGLHFTMSRIALLDIFLAFWIVCAVACLVADRDWVDRQPIDRELPRPLWRPWVLAAGVCFGLACGTKWSGLYVLATFGAAFFIWEMIDRRRWRSVIPVAVTSFISLVGVALVTYIVTWIPWLMHSKIVANSYGKGYGDYSAPWGDYVTNPTPGWWGATLDAFRNMWHYHVMTYNFHVNDLNDATHPYSSDPINWLVMKRPVAFATQSDLPASNCGAPSGSSCLSETLAAGNVIVWWVGSLAIVVAIVSWLFKRESRWSIPVLGMLSTWLPWFQYDDRPLFSFYAIAILPFLVIAICLVIDRGRRAADARWQQLAVGGLAVALAVAVVAMFVWQYPLLSSQVIPYDSWHSRLILGSNWI